MTRSLPAVQRPVFVVAVQGTPGPQGSKTRGRYGGLRESSEKVAPWREAVRHEATKKLELLRWNSSATFPLDEPLRAVMVFTVRKPGSAPKRRRTWPDRRPDLSKLIRSTEDALTDAGVFVEDARIVCVEAWKAFPGEHPDALDSPGCVIRLYRLTEEVG